jgi:eukaryotic-like serine/threonine-protein kinase
MSETPRGREDAARRDDATRVMPVSGASSDATVLGGGTEERPGTRIGVYKILQLIGEGGFGSVFLAEQEQPVRRKVALKIIKLGMDTRQVVARFEQERQALAMMDHPGIARVLDAGSTETGRPYFVMELVKGDPIVEYCDKQSLPIRERLEIFSQVCQAVQHAHTKGIIHRDIKPSNVLVSVLDGRPQAKVIDFGIAKATSARLTEKTLFTEHRALIGTPEYMSPEQAEGSLDIDTRSDVYSLGVLLYELLTGTTPFDPKTLRSAAYAEIQRIIREVEPPRPSTRLSEQSQTMAGIAARRHVEPRRLGVLLRGELDWIVMKAMEKDRTRRYETASGLWSDVQRYLGGEAVHAAPPSAGYRIGKFVRRHRGAVIAGGALVGTLLLGVVGTSVGLIGAQRQAERAVAAERTATQRLQESEATVSFLDRMLAAADPQVMGKDVTVRRVLDASSGMITKEYGEQPLVAARLHGTVGKTYMGLGLYPEAGTHLRDALAMRQKELGAAHADTCRAVNELDTFLMHSGDSEAEASIGAAIANHEKLFGREDVITQASMANMVELLLQQNREEECGKLAEELLAMRRRVLPKDDPQTIQTINSLATAYGGQLRAEESERLFDEAISALERTLGPDHPGTLSTRSNLAWMLYWTTMNLKIADTPAGKERLARAKVLGEQTLAARTRVLGEEHPDTLTSINNLASVYKKLGMVQEAETMVRRDLEISLRVMGEEHPDTIVSLANLGNSLREQKRYEEALTYLERAVRASKKVLPADNPGTAYALGWYGSSLRDLGRFAESEAPLLEAYRIIESVQGADSGTAQQMTEGLAALYEKWEQAEPGKGHGEKGARWRALGK